MNRCRNGVVSAEAQRAGRPFAVGSGEHDDQRHLAAPGGVEPLEQGSKCRIGLLRRHDRGVGTVRGAGVLTRSAGLVNLEARPAQRPLQPVRARRGVPEKQNVGTLPRIRHEIAHAPKET